MNQIIQLTIAIPTFNRADCLDRNLSILMPQVKRFHKSVEVIVSDNFSTDHTQEILEKYINLGFDIKYVRNKSNFGFDLNWVNCFNLANGNYLYVLGDDDILIPGALEKIMKIINANDYSLICMRAYGFASDFLKEKPKSFLKNSEFNDINLFVVKSGPLITFISSMIINKSLINHLDLKNLIDPLLTQIHLILRAGLAGKKSLFINDYLVAADRSNSAWGSKGLILFSKDLGRILDFYKPHGINAKTISRLNKKFLINYFPLVILRLLISKTIFNKKEMVQVFYNRYHSEYSFYIFCLPLFYLPRHLAIAYGFFSVATGKLIYGEFLSMFYFLKSQAFKFK
jgi:abequosyltransferase